jgi:uncharacterized protein (TIGR04255 family)
LQPVLCGRVGAGSAVRRQYRNPPLAEAVAELRFDPGGPWDQTLPGLIFEHLRDEFPVKRQVSMVTEELVHQGPEQFEKRWTPVERLQLRREDDSALVGLGPHYLSVSRLPPYEAWEEFRPLIDKAVDAYRAEAEPAGIIRAGLRAINRIHVGTEELDLREFFDFYPHVGDRLPDTHGPFLCGVQIPYADHRDLLRVQLADQPSEPGTATILLDLDYFLNRAGEIDFGGWSEWLEAAHVRVRDVFEGCITDRSRELFDEVTDS